MRKAIKKKIKELKGDYPKMTFGLSVFGFVASIAFYIGVLQDISEPQDAKDQKIEQLTQDNQLLKDHIKLLSKQTIPYSDTLK